MKTAKNLHLKTIVFAACIVALAIGVYLCHRPATTATTPIGNTPAGTGQRRQPERPRPAGGTNSKQANSIPNDSLAKAWAAKHRAGVQTTCGFDENSGMWTGEIRIGQRAIPTRQADVGAGDSPIRYEHDLEMSTAIMLLGRSTTRHSITLHLHSLSKSASIADDVREECRMTFPQTAKFYGLAFRREAESIGEVGIVLPELDVPEGDSPQSDQWNYVIRLNANGRFLSELDSSSLASVVATPLDGSLVVLMSPQSPPPALVRILWLRQNQSGGFDIVKNG